MKIISLFIAVLFCFAAHSQTYSTVATPIKWTKGGFDSLFIPQSDTLTPKDRTKSWLTLKDSSLYVWNGAKWKSVTGTSNNVYTANGTLSSDRTVTANQKKFYVTGAKQIYLKANDTGQVVQGFLSISKDAGIEMSLSNFPKAAGFMLPQEGGYAQTYAGNNTLEVNEDSVIVNGKNIARSVNGNLANPAGDISIDLSNYLQKQTQSPTATLTGGETRELMPTGADLPYTLSWSAGRVAATSAAQATANISTINVAGTNETFSNPSAGSTVSGTQAVTVVRNTNTTFTNTVTTADSKTATASTSVTFLPKRYWGWVSDTTGLRDGSADATIIALSSELSNSKSKSFSTGSPTGTQFFVYAYYATAGVLTQWDMNGFPSIDAVNSVTRNLTNSLGYTGSWIINWTKNGQTSPSSIVAN